MPLKGSPRHFQLPPEAVAPTSITMKHPQSFIKTSHGSGRLAIVLPALALAEEGMTYAIFCSLM